MLSSQTVSTPQAIALAWVIWAVSIPLITGQGPGTAMITYGRGNVNPPATLPNIMTMLMPPATGPVLPALIPANATAAALCPPREHFTRDYYWALCYDDEVSLACRGVLWYALAQANDCVNTRNSLVPGTLSQYGGSGGFWSSQCMCFPALYRLFDALASGTQDISAGGCTSSDLYNLQQALGFLPFNGTSSVLTAVFGQANVSLQNDWYINATAALAIAQQGPPDRMRWADYHSYHCDRSHSPTVQITSLLDTNPAFNASYWWQLYWTIPPDNSYATPAQANEAPSFGGGYWTLILALFIGILACCAM